MNSVQKTFVVSSLLVIMLLTASFIAGKGNLIYIALIPTLTAVVAFVINERKAT